MIPEMKKMTARIMMMRRMLGLILASYLAAGSGGGGDGREKATCLDGFMESQTMIRCLCGEA